MRSDLSAEMKLDTITQLLAHDLRVDDCACYILRAGEVLELQSSSAAAVAKTECPAVRFRVGEGPVGDIAASAAPVTLSDMPAGAGEKEAANANCYHSFCGVPVLRGGRVRGVLLVQSRARRAFGEEVVDILQTVAMVAAELIISGGLLTRLEINSSSTARGKPSLVEGVSHGRGLAIGTAVLYEPVLEMRDILAENPAAEKKRLTEALSSMHSAIDRMLNRNAALHGTESRDILEAYQMFAKDRGWLSRIKATIDKGLSAEAAVQRVQNETRARMMQMNDAYIRERLQDLEDLSNRLLSHLLKSGAAQRAEEGRAQEQERELPDNIILVARSLGPAALLDYDHKKLKGVILEKGSSTNHVAIVARALGIPVVGQCGDILNFIVPGDPVIVDGDHGVVYIGPSEHIVELYTRSMEARARRTSHYRRQVQQQQQNSVTLDGIKVSVQMNAGLMNEIDAVNAVGADGVGLFRTELAFMGLKKYPLVVTQAAFYGEIMDKLGDKPVAFRTLDIGGDKPLPYFKAPEEDNPALGWRAVRIGMDRPAVLRTQFRAFIRGARGRAVKIMLPFVTEVAEFDRARELLEMEKIRATQHGLPLPEKIELGVMIEVPALLWQLDALLKTADFVSVGTNDLMQYLFAADRGNMNIRARYDSLSPAMLAVLKTIADKCRAAGVPVSVCGEMAGQPLEAMVLIALGYQSLSVPAQAVEAVRLMVPSLDTRQLVPYLERLMSSREHSLRLRLLSFARDHKVKTAESE
ncbi:MAG: phosphoenolpyruvate--protein phosphotransferase [Alphaproteobacteria bacterium]|nr:phosphoenolpyruvate--protein phosphotransferase [Alphaproteobacteria bacterium]